MTSNESQINFQRVEVVRNINRFESSIKHKSNVFSVVVQNSNLQKDTSVDMTTPDDKLDTNMKNRRLLEKYKERLRDSITQFVRNTCVNTIPVHTQLFDVQFI